MGEISEERERERRTEPRKQRVRHRVVRYTRRATVKREEDEKN